MHHFTKFRGPALTGATDLYHEDALFPLLQELNL
jgi:hypothetical protein